MIARAITIALGIACVPGCSIDPPSPFGAPCRNGCGTGFVCGAGDVCVPGADLDAGPIDVAEGEGGGSVVGEGEGEGSVVGEGEGEGSIGEGEGEGEGRPCDDVCAVISLNGHCEGATVLAACADDDSCACDAVCQPATATCSGTSAPWLMAELSWTSPAGAAQHGPDLDLLATARDHDGKFCVNREPDQCEGFDTSGMLVEECGNDPLECNFETCDLTTSGPGVVTYQPPDWTDDTAGVNPQDPIHVGSGDSTASEFIALGTAPAPNVYIYGVTLCQLYDDVGDHASFELSFHDRQGTLLADCTGDVDAFLTSYRDAAIVHVDDAGNACIDCASGAFNCAP